MTNAIGSAHCSIQYHDKYKIVKTKKHRVVELQQYTDYDFEPYLMRWFTVLGKEFFVWYGAMIASMALSLIL